MRKNCIYYNRQNSKNGWGFCDLYDSSTGEVWELKRITCNEDKAKNQLANYVRGRLKNELDLKLTTGGRIIPDGEIRSFVYQDDSGTYTISYWDGGNGILWYDYEYERSKKQAETDAAIAIGTTTVACVAIAAVVLCSGGTAVAAAPAVIPFVVHAANAWSNAA